METLVIAGIVGFIAFIAGRGMVGANYVTTEHAKAIGLEMFNKGLREGLSSAAGGSSTATPSGLVRASSAQVLACDEYLKGFYEGMKAVRLHGDQAEEATEDHLIGVMQRKAQALSQG